MEEEKQYTFSVVVSKTTVAYKTVNVVAPSSLSAEIQAINQVSESEFTGGESMFNIESTLNTDTDALITPSVQGRGPVPQR
jgi:hypothetical protein